MSITLADILDAMARLRANAAPPPGLMRVHISPAVHKSLLSDRGLQQWAAHHGVTPDVLRTMREFPSLGFRLEVVA